MLYLHKQLLNENLSRWWLVVCIWEFIFRNHPFLDLFEYFCECVFVFKSVVRKESFAAALITANGASVALFFVCCAFIPVSPFSLPLTMSLTLKTVHTKRNVQTSTLAAKPGSSLMKKDVLSTTPWAWAASSTSEAKDDKSVSVWFSG